MSQTIDAVYEQGVFKPLQQVPLVDGQKVRLSYETDAGRRPAAEVLHLAQKVYEGLSEEEIDEIEAIALDRSNFFRDRQAE